MTSPCCAAPARSAASYVWPVGWQKKLLLPRAWTYSFPDNGRAGPLRTDSPGRPPLLTPAAGAIILRALAVRLPFVWSCFLPTQPRPRDPPLGLSLCLDGANICAFRAKLILCAVAGRTARPDTRLGSATRCRASFLPADKKETRQSKGSSRTPSGSLGADSQKPEPIFSLWRSRRRAIDMDQSPQRDPGYHFFVRGTVSSAAVSNFRLGPVPGLFCASPISDGTYARGDSGKLRRLIRYRVARSNRLERAIWPAIRLTLGETPGCRSKNNRECHR